MAVKEKRKRIKFFFYVVVYLLLTNRNIGASYLGSYGYYVGVNINMHLRHICFAI